MARKKIYFDRRAIKLGPNYYNCNERQTNCTRKSADPRNGCPNCEFTIQYLDFREKLDIELKEVGNRQSQQEWSSDYLLELANEVAAIHYGTPNRTPGRWDVVTAMLVGVYRDELTKMKAIDNLMTTNVSAQAPDENDEGDFD